MFDKASLRRTRARATSVIWWYHGMSGPKIGPSKYPFEPGVWSLPGRRDRAARRDEALEVVGDMLCDLAHELGRDLFLECIEQGLWHYTEETKELRG